MNLGQPLAKVYFPNPVYILISVSSSAQSQLMPSPGCAFMRSPNLGGPGHLCRSLRLQSRGCKGPRAGPQGRAKTLRGVTEEVHSVQCMGTKLLQSRPTHCDPMDCSPPGCSVHGDSPDKNTGVGCHALVQGIFPTQKSNPCLLWFLDRRRILYR